MDIKERKAQIVKIKEVYAKPFPTWALIMAKTKTHRDIAFVPSSRKLVTNAYILRVYGVNA